MKASIRSLATLGTAAAAAAAARTTTARARAWLPGQSEREEVRRKCLGGVPWEGVWLHLIRIRTRRKKILPR
eukprot:CAMPEP_0185285300 /NCGR_PEP_ID=MMETSP1363-20130426/1632_1 /TAXON_ID=38817 /ORGANISM="Gephyrocapsa oceanica, Strain RCC1303" /LENGTH=71 /DNA_ID=CAMNT_0027881071 /DNA_START=69 /DNA_END=281 /DNA_ORIENTATION=-